MTPTGWPTVGKRAGGYEPGFHGHRPARAPPRPQPDHSGSAAAAAAAAAILSTSAAAEPPPTRLLVPTAAGGEAEVAEPES